MKKLTILAVAALAISFASCKKDRVCTCTYTTTGSSTSGTNVTTMTKVSKGTAKKACVSGTSYNTTSASYITTYDCKLS
jgi:hypothetical protein